MNQTKGIIIGIVAGLAMIIMGVIWLNSIPANAIVYEEKVTEAKSAIKVQEKRRADLLPNLADAIKSFDQHEYETFVDTVNARKSKDGTITDEGMNEINKNINMVVENYPQITSQENYKEYMKEAAITENKIAETREAYNKTVSRYNTYTRNPLRKFILSFTGYERVEFQKLDYNVSEDAPTNLFNNK